MEKHANPIKKLVFNKQLSLISSTRKIQKSKKDASYAYANTQVRTYFLTVTVCGWSKAKEMKQNVFHNISCRHS